MKCPRCGRSMIIFASGAVYCSVCQDGYLKSELEKIMADVPRDPLLVEREKTHGSFADNARISQDIKYIFRHVNCKLEDVRQLEALDMIALKLSRILSGQPLEPDHWKDIAGYAKLGEEACYSK